MKHLCSFFILMSLMSVLSHPFEVERQEWVIQHMRGDIPSEEFDIGVTVDIPISGSPFLADSVVRLLNETLYYFFEGSIDPRFAPEALYCPDGKRLLQRYQEAYKPYIEDTCEFHGGCPDFFVYLSVTMKEQTESFVTYEVSNYFIGEGDFEYLEWVTFDKNDGHRLAKVVNDEDVIKFLKKTSGTDYDVWEDVEYRLLDGEKVAWRCSFGFTSDSLHCQYLYAPGIVETFSFGLESVKPYLTKEAAELLLTNE